jgi:hypothetical protein
MALKLESSALYELFGEFSTTESMLSSDNGARDWDTGEGEERCWGNGDDITVINGGGGGMLKKGGGCGGCELTGDWA